MAYYLTATCLLQNVGFLSSRPPLVEIRGDNNDSSVVFINCKFMNNVNSDSLIVTNNVNVRIVSCIFYGSSAILHLSGTFYDKITVVIQNTQFGDSVSSHDNKETSFIIITYANLLLVGMVTFYNITNHNSIISLSADSIIAVNGRIEFSYNSVCQLISFNNNNNPYIQIKEPSIISIHHNQMSNYFIMIPCKKSLYPFCIFQYLSNRTIEQSSISITFYKNQYKDNCKPQEYKISRRCYLPIIDNCHWSPQSTFNYMIPTDVNNWFIKYSNNSVKLNNDHSILCACNDQMEHDCSINDLGYLYPGEVLAIFYILRTKNIKLL